MSKDASRMAPRSGLVGAAPVLFVLQDCNPLNVFTDSRPLSSGSFPRLRKLLEGQTTLVLPQDFLDVHPDYISNETQMLTLQGPWSERDAQMTETFARLQDIYGSGRVLGILGNSVSQPVSYSGGEWRARRSADDDLSTTTAEPEYSAGGKNKYALYNATGPPGKGALLFSSGWPELRWPDGSATVLDTPVGEPTVKPTRLYTILVVRFADGDNTRDKLQPLPMSATTLGPRTSSSNHYRLPVYGPAGRRASYPASACSWSPLENSSTPTVIDSSADMTSPLPLHA
ncbi:unnamed protein product [Plutella xylostella]|uniref:(diamondback moth) hypothetical protein n=1 Tax=Plutella xylostella TaxID=51655 RepID=A0A8S4G9Z2_PLUXY|nr:unnamed protein product [Plutella xylostella]